MGIVGINLKLTKVSERSKISRISQGHCPSQGNWRKKTVEKCEQILCTCDFVVDISTSIKQLRANLTVVLLFSYFFLFFLRFFVWRSWPRCKSALGRWLCFCPLFLLFFVLNSFFAVYLMILVKISMGTGKMMVLLFSADMLLSVWRYRSCKKGNIYIF